MKSGILSCALLGVYAQLCFGMASISQTLPSGRGRLLARISDTTVADTASGGSTPSDASLFPAMAPQPASAAMAALEPLSGMADRSRQPGLADADPAASRSSEVVTPTGDRATSNSYLVSADDYRHDSRTAAALPPAAVSVPLTSSEARPVNVAHLRIIGNRAFPEGVLTHLFTVRPGGPLGRLAGHGQYTPDKLNDDLERLRNFYLDHGYVDFRVTGTQITPVGSGQGVDIAVSIAEGLPYRVSAIRVAGDLPSIPSGPMAALQLPSGNAVPTATQLEHLITLHAGDIFSRQRLADSIQRIGDLLGKIGYATARVEPQIQANQQTRTVAVTVLVIPGPRTYVRRINIKGNVVTREAVIRRELRQMEAAWYDSDAVRRSRARLEQLGYFSDVKIDSVPIPGSPDQVDLDVAVTERATGNLSFGAGYSTVDRFYGNAGISLPNLGGTGNRAAVNFFVGSVNRDLSLSYTNPYLTPDGVSRGFDLYTRRFNTKNLPGVAPFVASTTGADVRYGIPLSEQASADVGIGIENTKIGLYPGSPERFQQFVQQHGFSNSVVPLTAGLTSDTRDSSMAPTYGHLNSITTELGAGNLNYYKVTYQGQLVRPVADNSVLLLNLNLGYSGGQLPFYKNFFAGGPGTVRGFAWGTIGPKDPVDQNALGGTRLATASAEYFFPIPGLTDRNLRLSVFTDTGDVWGGSGNDDQFSFARWRLAAGLGVTWQSPLGPLKLSLAAPFKKQPSDSTQVLQLTFGTMF